MNTVSKYTQRRDSSVAPEFHEARVNKPEPNFWIRGSWECTFSPRKTASAAGRLRLCQAFPTHKQPQISSNPPCGICPLPGMAAGGKISLDCKTTSGSTDDSTAPSTLNQDVPFNTGCIGNFRSCLLLPKTWCAARLCD